MENPQLIFFLDFFQEFAETALKLQIRIPDILIENLQIPDSKSRNQIAIP